MKRISFIGHMGTTTNNRARKYLLYLIPFCSLSFFASECPAPSPTKYTITLDANSGKLGTKTTISVESGQTVPELTRDELPTRESFALAGWNKQADGKGDAFIFGTTAVTADITIYAQWTQSKPPTPTGLTATAAGADQIDLAWNHTTGATYYKLFDGDSDKQIGVDITERKYSHKGLAERSPHAYTLQACNTFGCSDKTTAVSATTQGIEITVTEIKNAGDIRPYYAIFSIKANAILSDYTLALKEKGTPPSAADMTNKNSLVFKRSINPTEMNIYAWGPIGTTVNIHDGMTAADARAMMLKHNTIYTLYGMENGKTEVKPLKDFTTDKEPSSSEVSGVTWLYDKSMYEKNPHVIRRGEPLIFMTPMKFNGNFFWHDNFNEAILNDCAPDNSCATANSRTFRYRAETNSAGLNNLSISISSWDDIDASSNRGVYSDFRLQYSTSVVRFILTPENPGPLTLLAFTTHPENKTVNFGAKASFSVVSTSGGILSYQWQKAESTAPSNWTNIEGATRQTYTTGASVDADQGDLYRVVVSNIVGSATSNPATLTVTIPDPSISVHPQNQQNILETTKAKFTVTGSAGGANLYYQWQKAERTASNEFVNIAGATIAEYTTPATDSIADNGDKFRCVVSNSVGKSVTSNAATLTIRISKPQISNHPSAITVTEGNEAKFSVSTLPAGVSYTYQWQKAESTAPSTFTNIAGATSKDYSFITSTRTNDNKDEYRVKVSNSVGKTIESNSAVLTVVTRPVFTKNLSTIPQYINDGGLYTVSVELDATTTGTLSYLWQKKGVDATTWEYAAGGTGINSYIQANAPKSQGNFNLRVIVTNEGGTSITSNVAEVRFN